MPKIRRKDRYLDKLHRHRSPILCCVYFGLYPHTKTTSIRKMSLPFIKTLADCTDFTNTVSPYLPQLYDLPQQILQSLSSPQALKALYTSTNPLISAFALSLFLFPVFLVVSEANKNYSQVDRCWSLLPTLYNAHFVLYAHAAGLSTRRLDVVSLCSTVWSVCVRSIETLAWS